MAVVPDKYQLEPKITINGVELTVGQSMTVRVAIAALIINIQSDGLGDDEHGKIMATAYIDRAREVERLLVA
jgi:hypothetical protein